MRFLIAAIIGMLLTWFWLTTAGKKHITKTITITETNWVT